MQMLKKIFKGDRKYYLELDELAESQPVQKVVETAEKIGDFAQEKAAELAKSQPVKEAVETAGKVADKVVDAAPEKLQSTLTTETKPAKSKAAKNGKVSKTGKVAKNGKNAVKKTAEKEPNKPAAAPQNSGASSYDPPFWVAAMYNNTSSNNGSANGSSDSGQTFATDNLMPIITKSRRRPGASLNQFKDMARKAKTPRS